MAAFVHSSGNGKNKIFDIYKGTGQVYAEGATICEVEITDMSRYNNLYVLWDNTDEYLYYRIISIDEIKSLNDTNLFSAGLKKLMFNLTGNTLKFYNGSTSGNNSQSIYCYPPTHFFLA